MPPQPIAEGEMPTGDETTPPESQPENKPADGTPPPAGGGTPGEPKPIPFNEDPKVQDYINRQMETRERALREEFDQRFNEFSDANRPPAATPPAGVPTEAQTWFAGDESQWKAFDHYLQQRDERVSQAAFERFQQDQQTKERAVSDANAWIQESVQSIEKDEGRSLTPDERTALFQTCLDNELIDTKSRWNYKAGWRILKGQPSSNPPANNQPLQDRKTLADATTTPDKGKESSGQVVRTSEDFRNPENRPWS